MMLVNEDQGLIIRRIFIKALHIVRETCNLPKEPNSTTQLADKVFFSGSFQVSFLTCGMEQLIPNGRNSSATAVQFRNVCRASSEDSQVSTCCSLYSRHHDICFILPNGVRSQAITDGHLVT